VPETSTVALRGLRDYGHVHEGQRVLIYSASGGIGTFAIQIAKYYGVEVTAVCSSGNTAMVRSLGADHVIDYRTEDFTKSGKLYDVVFAIRKSRPVREISRALAPGGIYVSTAGGSPYRLLQEFAIGPGLLKKEGKTMAVIAAVVDVKRPGNYHGTA
jgi:NADPH:quinone reductase-like Zn-dependent oxidoreductase